MQRPFLKWAGGKYQVLHYILKVLPPGKRLIEPFVGSGAVFLNTHYSNYLLGDNNLDLITLYQYLQKEGDEFITFCKEFFATENNERNRYCELRELFNLTKDSRLKSALFIYLNRHGYNGLCRYNHQGKFNVPFGRYVAPMLPSEKMLDFFLKAQNAIFECADFEVMIAKAHQGDVIYCDPPYVPLSTTAKFTSYTASQFNHDDQLRLVECAERSASRGITVVISNHDTPVTRKLYRNARLKHFKIRRYISCAATKRGEANELLAIYTPAAPKIHLL